MRFGRSLKRPSMPQPPQMPQQKPMIGGPGIAGVVGAQPTGRVGFEPGLNANAMTKMSALSNLMQGKPMKKGGVVKSSASKRADGIATKGKTKGRMV